MEYVKLGTRLGLIRVVPKPKEKPKIQAHKNVNHIWIYDRSGSMHYLLPELANDMCFKVDTISTGDTLSLGWFSGVGDFRFIFKGMRVQTPADREVIKKTIIAESSSRNTTCFSEILEDASMVVNDLKAFAMTYSLMFFTDGYPVVPNYNLEINSIMRAIDNLRGIVETALFVGYGWAYNKELMAKMTERIGGVLIHSRDILDFSLPFTELVNKSKISTPLVEVETNIEDDCVLASFYLDTNKMPVLINHDDGKLLLPEAVTEAYVLCNGSYKSMTQVPVEEYLSECYAAAMIMSQKVKADIAIQILGKIGDIKYIEELYSAFTNEEFGSIEQEISKSIVDPVWRFMEGKRFNYLPSPNRFCLMDAIELLRNDDAAHFYPYIKGWEYNRISIATKQEENTPKFHHADNVSCPMNMFTWNDTRLNLSILARIHGYVTLIGDCEKYGFARDFPTFIYRNYTIVKDGNLNVKSIYVSMSEETFNTLKKKGMIGYSESYASNQPYKVYLSKVPIINKSYALDVPTAQDYCKFVYNEKVLETRLKVLRNKLDEIEPVQKISEVYTQEQEEFLKSNFIGKNGFSPSVIKEEPKDYYMAMEFEVKMAGFSSLPKVQDVVDRVKSMKSLTPVQDMMMKEISALPTGDNLTPLWLKNEIEKAKKQLAAVRKYLQFTRFTVLLCKKWFTDLTVRDGAKVTDSNGIEYTFSIRDVKVNY